MDLLEANLPASDKQSFLVVEFRNTHGAVHAFVETFLIPYRFVSIPLRIDLLVLYFIFFEVIIKEKFFFVLVLPPFVEDII